MNTFFMCICVAAPVDAAQLEAPSAQVDRDAHERFAMLRSTQKAMLFARVRNRLAQSGNAAFHRIHSMRIADADELPEARATPVFDPAKHAPGQAPKRAVIDPNSREWRTTRKRFARTPLLGDLHAQVSYDWCRGKIVTAERLSYEEIFDNLLRGYAPGTDHAVAQVMAKLDSEADMRGLAHWFGHSFADLKARAFVGITLYDAWYSGEAIDVPDVDAIPFAHDILGRRSMRSPLSGRPRAQLYEAIKQAALIYRKYRTLREAAAAAYVRAEPSMDAIYARLVPRFHALYPEHADSIEAIRKLLEGEDRDSLLADIDRRVKEENSEAWKLLTARRNELTELATKTRAFALEELDFFTGRRR